MSTPAIHEARLSAHAAALERLARGIRDYPAAARGLAKCAALHAGKIAELAPRAPTA